MTGWARTAALWLLAASGLSAAAQAVDPWAPLKLSTTNMLDVVVHYSPGLAPQLASLKPVLADVKESTRSAQLEMKHLAGSRDQIFEDLFALTGLSPSLEERGQLNKGFKELFTMGLSPLRFDLPERPFQLYVVYSKDVRRYVRDGGTLPGFTYDEKSDRAHFQARMGIGPDEGSTDFGMTWLPIPVKEGSGLGDSLEPLRATAAMSRSPMGMVLNGISEMVLLLRLKSPDPFVRWFTAGFANQLTYHLLQQHISQEDARRFMKVFDTTQYADLKQEVSLRFWPTESYEVDSPFPREHRLRRARHAYATFEAGRVVQLHGIKVLKPILDEAVKQTPTGSKALLDAMEKVTGSSMLERLQQYQLDPSLERTVEMYRERSEIGRKERNAEAVLAMVLRVREINPVFDPKTYFHIARLMLDSGYPEAADRVFLKAMSGLAPRQREEVKRIYVDYLLKTSQPHRALNVSAEVLKNDPMHLPSLSVQMLHAIHQKRILDAGRIAQEIIRRDEGKNSTYAMNARKVIEEFRKQAETIKTPENDHVPSPAPSP